MLSKDEAVLRGGGGGVGMLVCVVVVVGVRLFAY